MTSEFNEINSNGIFSKTRHIFCIFFFDFWNLHQILNILKKKMSLIADVFPKL